MVQRHSRGYWPVMQEIFIVVASTFVTVKENNRPRADTKKKLTILIAIMGTVICGFFSIYFVLELAVSSGIRKITMITIISNKQPRMQPR